MIISVGVLSAIDTIVKHVANEGMHPVQIVFFRNLFGLIVLFPIFLKSGFTQLRTQRYGFHLARGIVHSGSMISWFVALTLIPLAEATALSFIIPIYASVGAILFMGERSENKRWWAISLGFIGMLVILRPGFLDINFGSILVVGSAIAVAASKLMVKSLARTDTPITIVFYLSLTLTIITLVPAIFFWTWPTMENWLWLILLGTGGSLAHVLQAHAYKVGEITAVEPVSYIRLLWAALFGFILFNELPSTWTWIGTAIIVSGAILLTHSESAKINKTPTSPSIDHL